MHCARWIVLLSAVGLLAASAWLMTPPPGASAADLPPGGAGSPDIFTGQAAGTLVGVLLGTYVATTMSGTARQAVFRNAGGSLDFYFQVSNNASSRSSVARVTAGGF